MKRMLARFLRDERGLETVEWVMMGALMLTLVAATYSVLRGNAQLRAALSATVSRYAVSFGGDVAARSPGRAPQPGTIQLVDQSQFVPSTQTGAVIDPQNAARVVLDSQSQQLVLLDPATYGQTLIRPADGVRATVDAASGQLRLEDPLRRITATFSPASGTGVVVMPDTGALLRVDLASLQHMRLIELDQQAPAALGPRLAAPALGIPSLFNAAR